jgi:hypothetical protein
MDNVGGVDHHSLYLSSGALVWRQDHGGSFVVVRGEREVVRGEEAAFGAGRGRHERELISFHSCSCLLLTA